MQSFRKEYGLILFLINSRNRGHCISITTFLCTWAFHFQPLVHRYLSVVRLSAANWVKILIILELSSFLALICHYFMCFQGKICSLCDSVALYINFIFSLCCHCHWSHQHSPRRSCSHYRYTNNNYLLGGKWITAKAKIVLLQLARGILNKLRTALGNRTSCFGLSWIKLHRDEMKKRAFGLCTLTCLCIRK